MVIVKSHVVNVSAKSKENNDYGRDAMKLFSIIILVKTQSKNTKLSEQIQFTLFKNNSNPVIPVYNEL